MKFPPGYGYPSSDNWERINAENDPLRPKGKPMVWIWTLLGIWFAGFILTAIFNAIGSPNVTLPLALLRAAVWPIFWATGWPHGTPLPMD